MSLDTWVSIGVLFAFAIALFGYLGNIRRDLGTRIDKVETDLSTKIDNSHADLKQDIGRIEIRLIALEERTYDISTRLPAVSAPPTS